ncbi:ATP-dependent 6-phosphofructokinase [Robiginitalea aurantiaca]|uniref:ATP-dependent 6-phosphofructokinase n=1 Tax=Robiginitalea aurantiaca TaxID=3056915 RepID=A0ABT7WHY3_9FLAO|nr:ATP-dependent 6-phosphofructokinase [Robiginitalea aurantiaca]MDM9632538.1 ATP-dependent 6-phosphofructokinase [Robiginitalea aurantiaca]
MKTDRFKIKTLGPASLTSPLPLSSEKGDKLFNFVTDAQKVLFNPGLEAYSLGLKEGGIPAAVEKAGPRKKIFFDPAKTTAAIVTCGGLCPGINNVIRSLVMGLHYFYGVPRIIGIPYGYQGLGPDNPHPYHDLNPDKVRDIHQFGGTILGSSRGGQKASDIVDSLVRMNIDMLFTIGGDGTLKGCEAIGQEVEKRGLDISVIGIPKTIDNDIDLIDKSFGFETAFDVASPIIRDAHNEAKGAYNGIAIVKLMGRDSGFIAASASMAMPEVNFLLVPELPFQLEGKDGFLNLLKRRLKAKQHAVIVVAEGAGQHLFESDSEIRDASGNIKHKDIGVLLKERIDAYFKAEQTEVTIKYIDPSYIIRSAPANASDSIFCNRLAYQAVHGAMAGKTRFVVGLLNNQLVYLPIDEVVMRRKKIDLEGEFWFAALQSTGQPFNMG